MNDLYVLAAERDGCEAVLFANASEEDVEVLTNLETDMDIYCISEGCNLEGTGRRLAGCDLIKIPSGTVMLLKK